ncbi:hypothetical protein BDV96DRAFT_382876 [Lophiotrema nucula]|uniref:DUF7730 domain-containing protein n=1 Tax=Lophiotrema nucula TaxID=690887 RepID=A0A6A5ZFT4_9PLEO|nr:hypothetical protein BDV96DRAFT_382876 [Lophiotrema nucula]
MYMLTLTRDEQSSIIVDDYLSETPGWVTNAKLMVSKMPYFSFPMLNTKNSRLLRLPAEVRHSIFTLVLGGKKIQIDPMTSKLGVSEFKDPYSVFELSETLQRYQSVRHFALLQTCRQVYAETALLPFALNVLWFIEEASLQRLIDEQNVLMPQLNAIATVQFCAKKGALFDGETKIAGLRLLSGLKKVYVNVSMRDDYDRWHGKISKEEVDETKSNERGLERAIKAVVGDTVQVVFYHLIPYGTVSLRHSGKVGLHSR